MVKCHYAECCSAERHELSHVQLKTNSTFEQILFIVIPSVVMPSVARPSVPAPDGDLGFFLPSLGFPPFCLFAVVTSSKASAATRQLTLQPSRRFKARQRSAVLGSALTVHKGQTNTFASFQKEQHVFEFPCNIDGATERVYEFYT